MGNNAELIQNLYEAFGKGDVPTVLGAFAPHIQWREAEGFYLAEGNPYVGPQAVAEGVFQRIVSDLDDFTVVPQNTIDGGDTVVVEGRYRGKVKSTGKAVDAQFAHVWGFEDGKVVRFQQYTDTEQWRAARA